MWKRPVIDVHTVLGAICIYVLIGMMFSFIYATIDLLGSEPFFVQTNVANTADYLYFSFVTITTVGYGDFTAAPGSGARSRQSRRCSARCTSSRWWPRSSRA